MNTTPLAIGGTLGAAALGGTGFFIGRSTVSTEQNTVISKLAQAGFALRENLSSEDIEKLNKKYEEDKFKKNVVDYARSKDFRTRAVELGINLLSTENKNDYLKGDSEWKKKWISKNTRDRIKSIISQDKDKNITAWEKLEIETRKNILSLCEKGKVNALNKEITEEIKDKDWKQYLEICAKEDEQKDGKPKKLTEILKKDFWTNSVTTEASQKQE